MNTQPINNLDANSLYPTTADGRRVVPHPHARRLIVENNRLREEINELRMMLGMRENSAELETARYGGGGGGR